MSPTKTIETIGENSYVRIGLVVGLVVTAFLVGSDQAGQKKTLEQTQKDVQEIKSLLLNQSKNVVTRPEVQYWLDAFSERNPDISVPAILPLKDE